MELSDRNTQKPLRAVIVDDEQPARELLRYLLTQQNVEIAAECSSGKKAVAAITRYAPDVVFLDIQMPGMNGFEVIETVGIDIMPPVIFVTAYDQHALKAFEVNAADYLLKPFSLQRFAQALQHIRKRSVQTTPTRRTRLKQIIEYWRQPVATLPQSEETEWLQRITVQEGKRVLVISVSDIDWITSSDHYITVSVNGEKYLVYEALSSILTRLDPRIFIRIHRTVIINISSVQQIVRSTNGSYHVAMKDGTTFPISRLRRSLLAKVLATS